MLTPMPSPTPLPEGVVPMGPEVGASGIPVQIDESDDFPVVMGDT